MAKRNVNMTVGKALLIDAGIATSVVVALAVLYVVYFWTMLAAPRWELFWQRAGNEIGIRTVIGVWFGVFALLLPYFMTMVYSQESRID